MRRLIRAYKYFRNTANIYSEAYERGFELRDLGFYDPETLTYDAEFKRRLSEEERRFDERRLFENISAVSYCFNLITASILSGVLHPRKSANTRRINGMRIKTAEV